MSLLKTFFADCLSCCNLLINALRQLRFFPQQKWRFIEHICFMGYSSLPIIGVLSLFIGAVLALQTGYALSQMPGVQVYLGSIVGLSICRELGPVMTAFLLAGRVGSAITAELASMKVYSEIDALKTMNLPPERSLVMPRLVATLLMMPILTLFSIILGWFGGMIAVKYVSFIQISVPNYWYFLKEFVDYKSLKDGLLKAEVFGIIVTIICCHVGLQTKGGPIEIGRAVTRGVVTSMVLILVFDYLVTKALL